MDQMPSKVITVKAERVSENSSGFENFVIDINDPAANAVRNYPNNFIRTSKYTLINFIPKNLWEQFRRISNIYFAIVVVIQFIPGLTPYFPITSLLPLAFVILVSAIKEAVEDFYRHQADKRNNREPFLVLRDGQEVRIPSEKIQVGDIVFVPEKKFFPADLVLLSSVAEDGIAYVQTANLDGETNLKMRKAIDETCKFQNLETITSLRGVIQCELPNERLYHFNGRLLTQTSQGKQVFALDANQLLQRGALLMNTKWVYGIVVYAGVDTKLSLNQQKPPSKFSTVERHLNWFIAGIFTFQMSMCFLSAVLSGVFDGDHRDSWYLDLESNFPTPIFALRNFATYFILFNTMIPISLWVTLEIVKVGQARFMQWDDKMSIKKTKENEYEIFADGHASAKTSNLNEDLGRIEHIFSDKTGTLTENIMRFSKCSVAGTVFDEGTEPGNLEKALVAENSEMMKLFLQILSLCNTAVAQIEANGEVEYKAQSPDEIALVDTANKNGYKLLERSSGQVTIEELGNRTSYEVLATLEFTSARRRMSVIVRTPDDRVLLFCKGADIVIYDRLIPHEDEQLKEKITEDLKMFSKEGLRTLCLGYKEINKAEWEEWRETYHQASTSIDNREERVEAACELIENDLHLVGCTAIEDKLQEEVPETIQFLLDAGIKIWVLTGDKQETAINIGYSSKLLREDMELVILNAENSDLCGELLRNSLRRYCNKNYGFDGTITDLPPKDLDPVVLGLVVDGHTLGFAVHDHPEAFLALGRSCRSVLCCRVTPLQKAKVVSLVKEGEKRVCLSIGDGANDVSMIQEAHVGVGIYGKEGTQAARASDYAIQQFRHLKRLLCVHGRYSYLRVTGIIQYCFYKNICFTSGLLFFSFFNGFTGQSLYDAWIITFYNIFFTSLPPLFYGLFEKDLSEDIVLRHPQVYSRMQKGLLFTKKTFSIWMVNACWHSVVTYFGTYFWFQSDIMLENGLTGGIWHMGVVASTIAILIVDLKMALEINYWTVLSHFAIWGSVLTYIITITLYSAVPDLTMTYIWYQVLATPTFYFLVLLLMFAALCPDFVFQYLSRQYWPSDWQVLKEKYLIQEKSSLEPVVSFSTTELIDS